jgi:flagellar hook assembly protein FlgD
MRAPEVPAFVTSLALPQPNPFNPSTTLKFTLAEAGRAEIVIYDTRGAAVKTLVSAELSAGPHDVVWHGSDDHGRPVASGLYFARLKCRTGSGVQRLMLIR